MTQVDTSMTRIEIGFHIRKVVHREDAEFKIGNRYPKAEGWAKDADNRLNLQTL